MSLFDNSSADTDRAQQLANYGRLSAAGTNLGTSGASDTGDAAAYFKNLLSGNASTVAAAAAPVTNVIAGQAAEARKAIGAGGDRTGGTNVTTQVLNDNARGQDTDAILKARGGAAAPLASIGGQETGQGLQADSTVGSEATANRAESYKEHNDAVENWGNVADTLAHNGAVQNFAKTIGGFLLGA